MFFLLATPCQREKILYSYVAQIKKETVPFREMLSVLHFIEPLKRGDRSEPPWRAAEIDVRFDPPF